jgi:hypothetical protein
MIVNGHSITIEGDKYVVTHPAKGVLTRIPRGPGAKARAAKFAEVQQGPRGRRR